MKSKIHFVLVKPLTVNWSKSGGGGGLNFLILLKRWVAKFSATTVISLSSNCKLVISNICYETNTQRWAGPQRVPLCAFPQLAHQGNSLRMCALINRQLTAELRLRTKKYSCGPYFHYTQYRR